MHGNGNRLMVPYPFSDDSASEGEEKKKVGIEKPERKLYPNIGPISTVEAEIAELPIKSGYLYKKGEKRKRWKKRWFVLRATKLSYYDNEKEYELLAMLELHYIHSISVVENNKFCFVTKQRTYFFEAESQEEMFSWIAFIRVMIKEGEKFTKGAISLDRIKQLVSQQLKNALNVETNSLLSNPASIESKLTFISTPSMANINAASSSISPIHEEPEPTPVSHIGQHFPRDDTSSSEDDEEEDVSPIVNEQRKVGVSDERNGSSSKNGDDQYKDGVLGEDRIVLTGYLEKYSKKLNKSWRKRWFVLRNGTLTLYKNEKEYAVSRLIRLSEVLDVLEIDSQGKSHSHCFKVVLPKKELILSSETEALSKQWVESLKKVREGRLTG